ncbi:MAG: response regulator [Desulfuromonas sp.]|nr:MAG: response regulator [Desulfuromonas sp.]
MKKILVAEDSLSMRALIVTTLGVLGEFEIVEVDNGFDALRVLPREQVDMVITDINMPDINGLELIRFVRNHPQYEKTPVLIISTERTEKDRERGLALGADAYLTKPFQPEQLQGLVDDLLRQGS